MNKITESVKELDRSDFDQQFIDLTCELRKLIDDKLVGKRLDYSLNACLYCFCSLIANGFFGQIKKENAEEYAKQMACIIGKQILINIKYLQKEEK